MSDRVKDTGILFTGAMVRAILAGRKKVTRRAIKGAPLNRESYLLGVNDGVWGIHADARHDEGSWRGRCPYGVPGDRLWVRETHRAWGKWCVRFNATKGRDEWHFVDLTHETGRIYGYEADDTDGAFSPPTRQADMLGWWRRPAIFMPRDACRLHLEVTGVSVMRLTDITEAQAVDEGVTVDRTTLNIDADIIGFDEFGAVWSDGKRRLHLHRDAFLELWADINGQESEEQDPWVYAVQFKRVPRG